ncbi:alcohol acetyltransferase [Mycena vulgaris]|nr:alcohol acetyltransferase [Mycena vulgaris]
MPALTRLRRIGLLERYHVTRHFMGMDSCVVGSAQYTAQDGSPLRKEVLFPALRSLIEAHAPLGVRLEGDEATSNVYLVRLPSVDLSRVVEFSGNHDLREAFEGQLARNFETQGDLPLWRVEVLPGNVVIFVVHHAIGDGMSCTAFHLNLFRALQKGYAENTSSSVRVPTTTVLLPPIERATGVRPSVSKVCSEIYTLVAPASWTKAGSAWSGNPTLVTPDLKTHVRLSTFSAPEVEKFINACRAHGATLTSTVHVLAVCVLSRMLGDDPTKYKRVATLVAVSLRGIAGVSGDVICDYPSSHRMFPRANTEFSWKSAERLARELQGQKRKGAEMVGMLRLLFGKYVPYLQDLLGTKRESGFELSNLGRIRAPALEGKWMIGSTFFTQCDVVGAAFSINVTGDPTGVLNVTFAWGDANIDAAFVESFISLFEEAFRSVNI